MRSRKKAGDREMLASAMFKASKVDEIDPKYHALSM